MAFELLSRLACSARQVGHLWLALTVLIRYVFSIEAREVTPLRQCCCSVRDMTDRAVAQCSIQEVSKFIWFAQAGNIVRTGYHLFRFHFVVARALGPSGLGCLKE